MSKSTIQRALDSLNLSRADVSAHSPITTVYDAADWIDTETLRTARESILDAMEDIRGKLPMEFHPDNGHKGGDAAGQAAWDRRKF